MERERWLGFEWGEEGVMGLSGPETEDLQEKLLQLRTELHKLNEHGTRLIFVSKLMHTQYTHMYAYYHTYTHI